VCVCVFVCVCKYVYVGVRVSVCKSVGVHIYVCVCACAWMCASVCLCMCARVFVCVCVCICVRAYACVCACVYVYVCACSVCEYAYVCVYVSVCIVPAALRAAWRPREYADGTSKRGNVRGLISCNCCTVYRRNATCDPLAISGSSKSLTQQVSRKNEELRELVHKVLLPSTRSAHPSHNLYFPPSLSFRRHTRAKCFADREQPRMGWGCEGGEWISICPRVNPTIYDFVLYMHPAPRVR
jgi:hypothetical protein